MIVFQTRDVLARTWVVAVAITIIAACAARTEAQVVPGVRGQDDGDGLTRAFERPVALLASIGIAMENAIDTADGCHGKYALACVTAGEQVIHLTREAVHLDARALAAILAHERLHVLGELHEGPAYDEELRVLKLLHGPSEAFARVRVAHELHRFDYPAESHLPQ
jgi:hypothetical protein